MRRAVCVVLALCLASTSWAGVAASGEVATAMVQEIQACRDFRAVAVERFDLYEQAAAAMEEQRGLDGERIRGLEADKAALKETVTTYQEAVTEIEGSNKRLIEKAIDVGQRLEAYERSKPSRVTDMLLGAAAGLLLGILAGR